MGRIHAEGYRKIADRVDLVFRSGSAERAREFAERFGGAGWCTDYAEAVERADIVDICTTHDLHLPMVKEAFARGRHVLVEKPIARTLEEADEMLTAAKAAGRKFMVCENLAAHSHVMEIDRVLREGGIGEPFLIETSSLSFWQSLTRSGWRTDFEKTGGGILIDLGAHYAYLVRKWCPNLATVFARMSHATFRRKGEDTAVVVACDRGGLTATIHVSWGAPGAPVLPMAVVYGTEGTLISSDEGLFLSSGGDEESAKRTKLCDGPLGPLWNESIGAAARAFVECVEKDSEPPVTGGMGRGVLELIVAANASAEEGRAVALPLSGGAPH
jgi:predicted dehydrogenase